MPKGNKNKKKTATIPTIQNKFNSFPGMGGMALWGGPPTGAHIGKVITWLMFHLSPPLMLSLCTDLAHSNCHWGFLACFQKLGFLVWAKTNTNNMLLHHI